jgi:DNA-binding IclR family transcriptional regulator
MPQQTWSFLAIQDYDKEYSVNDLVSSLKLPENTVRDQLASLRKQDLVTRRWDGRRYVFRRRVYNVVAN